MYIGIYSREHFKEVYTSIVLDMHKTENQYD